MNLLFLLYESWVIFHFFYIGFKALPEPDSLLLLLLLGLLNFVNAMNLFIGHCHGILVDFINKVMNEFL